MTVVECPNCKKHMRVTVSSDDPTVFDVFCHECKIALEIEGIRSRMGNEL